MTEASQTSALNERQTNENNHCITCTALHTMRMYTDSHVTEATKTKQDNTEQVVCLLDGLLDVHLDCNQCRQTFCYGSSAWASNVNLKGHL